MRVSPKCHGCNRIIYLSEFMWKKFIEMNPVYHADFWVCRECYAKWLSPFERSIIKIKPHVIVRISKCESPKQDLVLHHQDPNC